ncbi:hypothetical protein Dimus_005885 [Dionaea muscipula]
MGEDVVAHVKMVTRSYVWKCCPQAVVYGRLGVMPADRGARCPRIRHCWPWGTRPACASAGHEACYSRAPWVLTECGGVSRTRSPRHTRGGLLVGVAGHTPCSLPAWLSCAGHARSGWPCWPLPAQGLVACIGPSWPRMAWLVALTITRAWPGWPRWPLLTHGRVWVGAAFGRALVAAVVAMRIRVFVCISGGYVLACMAMHPWTYSDGHVRIERLPDAGLLLRNGLPNMKVLLHAGPSNGLLCTAWAAVESCCCAMACCAKFVAVYWLRKMYTLALLQRLHAVLLQCAWWHDGQHMIGLNCFKLH